jgi:hypothetical protein
VHSDASGYIYTVDLRDNIIISSIDENTDSGIIRFRAYYELD